MSPSTSAAAIAASIARSTAELDYPGLAARLERLLYASEGRSACGPMASAYRSDAVRGRIRAAWGALPIPQGPITGADVNVGLGRMDARGWTADPRTIRAELECMRAEMQTSTAMST